MNLLVLPVLIPLAAGALLLALPRPAVRFGVALAAAGLGLFVDLLIAQRALLGEVLVVQMANWPAPWGISLVADGLSGVMLALSGVVGFLTVVLLGSSLRHPSRHGVSNARNLARERFGAQALLQFLLMGVNMSFLTGDLFNLFVAFEVMLIASYGLMLLGNETRQLREGLKYVVINLLASAVFVLAAGLAYGLFGTLNMADIALRLAAHGPDLRVSLVALLLALVFVTKAALFPLGFWLPSSYPAPPAAVSAIFAALLTKVGVYALLRSFTLMFPAETTLQGGLAVLGALTILFGSLGMIARQRWRPALAFANVASVGYLALALFSPGSLQAGLFYLIHSVLLTFAVFAVAALAELVAGEDYRDEGHLSVYPWLGAGFFVSALALAGIPPTSGFVGKYGIIAALFAERSALSAALAVVAVLGSLLLLYGAVQIWRGFFWGEDDAVHRLRLPRGMTVATGAAVGLVLALTVSAGPIYAMCGNVAAELRGNEAYLARVMAPVPEPEEHP